MKWLFLLLLTPLFLRGADEDNTWSKPVNGLQARLVISPLKKGADGRLHMGLSFQIQRQGQMIQVAYTPDTLHARVIDQNGKELPSDGLGGNQPGPPWRPLILPSDASMSIPVGGSWWQGSGQMLGENLQFNRWTDWIIPPPDTNTYYLTGTFTIPAPSRLTGEIPIWSGTLDLPKVEIPRVPY
jgi:hypothetical protein